MDYQNNKKSCFAWIDNEKCNALTEKECKNCKFYKKRKAIKNNPYYPYSYKSMKDFETDLKKYNLRYID